MENFKLFMHELVHNVNYFVLFFAISVMFSYLLLALISSRALSSYLRRNRYVNFQSLLALPHAPKISVIAPAYNEGFTIEENVRSLLAINYNNFEVIVVNDGSKDNSIEILTQAFDLKEVPFDYNPVIPTKEIKAVYRSQNPSFSKLVIVDKFNGGKADALNVGINISENPYVVCIDVDCILDKDVLLRLVKPFLEGSTKKVIATGGVVRIANSCVVRSGRMVKINAPKNWLARIQVLEYLRAFILGRMAWSKLDGLLLISGAFGMFDRQLVIDAGGYNPKTVGEDMELVVRMRRYMIEKKVPYKVEFIPEPLCWTEAPESFEVLLKQRSRWTRGTFETLWMHRKMLLNPKYKFLGMVSFPYWLLYEYLAPVIEFIGLLITIYLLAIGVLNWSYMLLLLAFVYMFAVMFSTIAIFAEESAFKTYTSYRDLKKLILIALLEPIIFHPFTVYAAMKGNWEKIRGKKSWGEMTRKGFDKKS